MIEIHTSAVVLAFLKMMSLSCKRKKEFQIFLVSRDLRTLEPRSKFILKKCIFFSIQNQMVET